MADLLAALYFVWAMLFILTPLLAITLLIGSATYWGIVQFVRWAVSTPRRR